MFRDGNEICKLISRGRARKNEPNSHENSRDREFSLCSGQSEFEQRPNFECVWYIKASLKCWLNSVLKYYFLINGYALWLESGIKPPSVCCFDFRTRQIISTMFTLSRAAEIVAAQQRRCELSKGLVSRARMFYANSESNREQKRS